MGRSFARAALAAGDRVAATARDTSSLDDLVTEHGDAILPIELDVTDRDGAFGAVRRARDHFGRLDVVVNNAGYGVSGAVEELTEGQARRQIEVNLFGALWMTQAALPIPRDQRSGWIVQENNGSQPGNPDLAAQALLDTLDRKDPPFRLLLGNIAYDVAVNRYESRLAEFRAGEPVARGADDR